MEACRPEEHRRVINKRKCRKLSHSLTWRENSRQSNVSESFTATRTDIRAHLLLRVLTVQKKHCSWQHVWMHRSRWIKSNRGFKGKRLGAFNTPFRHEQWYTDNNIAITKDDHLDIGFLSWFPCVLKANAEVVPIYPRCHYMLLM